MDDYAAAIRMFESAVNEYPLYSWPRKGLSESYIAIGQYDAAIGVYQEAVLEIPIDYSFCKNLGDAWLVKLNYKSAIEAYNLAIKRTPRTLFLLAYVSIRPFGSAAALRIDDRLVECFIWHQLGKAYKGNGEQNAAAEIYDSAIRGYRAAIDAKVDLLWIPQLPKPRIGDFEVFHMSCALPTAVVWSILGEAHKAKGENSNAKEAFERAAEMEPDNLWLRVQLEECNGKDGIYI